MELSDFTKRIANRESFLLANDTQFLGKLNLNEYDGESIFNKYNNYGSKYSSLSIFNQYGNYGSKYSSLSPFNAYTSTPPAIYFNGQHYGYLTKNKYVGMNVVDPDNLQEWLVFNNLRH